MAAEVNTHPARRSLRRTQRAWYARQTRRKESEMASENVHEFTDANFDAEVLKSDRPTLVDFWAVWCGPCRAIAPIVEGLAKQWEGKIKVGKLDVDHNQRVAANFGIRSIPTLLLFKDGKVVDQLVGAGPQTKGKLEEAFKKATV
jgi:thioredoxin 1